MAQEVNQRVRKSLDQGKIGSADITDGRLRRFMEFLKANKLDDIVLVGGAVRDAVIGAGGRDFDITVKLPLSSREAAVMTPLTQEAYLKAEAALARLAKALGVTVEQIKDKNHPVMFEGGPLQYLGPGLSSGSKELAVKALIVDERTETVAVGYTGAEILFMGLDANGKLYDHKRAL